MATAMLTCSFCQKVGQSIRLNQCRSVRVLPAVRSPSSESPDFVIPNKILRDNLAVLKALGNTVKQESRLPPYTLLDDPQLLPHNARNSKWEHEKMLLSKAYGRRTAQAIIAEKPKFFWLRPMHDHSLPSPEAFRTGSMAKLQYEKDSVLGLRERIFKRRANEVEASYEEIVLKEDEGRGKVVTIDLEKELSQEELKYVMPTAECVYIEPNAETGFWIGYAHYASTDEARSAAEEQVEWRGEPLRLSYKPELSTHTVSRHLKLQLLAVLAFEEGKTLLQSAYKEEISVDRNYLLFDCEAINHEPLSEDHIIWQLFEDLNDSHDAYAIMISLLMKRRQHQKAVELYYTMNEKDIPVSLHIYNELLNISDRDINKGKYFSKRILKEMMRCGVKPDRTSFANILAHDHSEQLILFFNEMVAIGLEPPLVAYRGVLQCLNRKDKQIEHMSKCFHVILDHLQGKSFEPFHPKDYLFFMMASKQALNLPDLTALRKLHAFLEYGTNDRLLTLGFSSSYYMNLLQAMIKHSEDLDEIMTVFDKVVPHRVHPTADQYFGILQKIDQEEAYHQLPRLWSVLSWQQQTVKEDWKFLYHFTRVMTKVEDPALKAHLPEMVEVLMFEHYTRAVVLAAMTKTRVIFHAAVLGNLIHVLSNCKEMEKAWKLYELYETDKETIKYKIRNETLLAFFNSLVDNRHGDTAVHVYERATSDEFLWLEEGENLEKSRVPLTDGGSAKLRELIEKQRALKLAKELNGEDTKEGLSNELEGPSNELEGPSNEWEGHSKKWEGHSKKWEGHSKGDGEHWRGMKAGKWRRGVDNKQHYDDDE